MSQHALGMCGFKKRILTGDNITGEKVTANNIRCDFYIHRVQLCEISISDELEDSDDVYSSVIFDKFFLWKKLSKLISKVIRKFHLTVPIFTSI